MPMISDLMLRNDVLLDIATFLARRWTNNPSLVIILRNEKMPIAKPDKNQIVLPLLNHFPGTDFQKYRQWRVSIWYESMRLVYCRKVLSYDHIFGFLLNTLETKRIEILGLQYWKGMRNEVIFNEGISWLAKPLLNTLYGKHKIAEAFSQYFLTGFVKGELYGNEFEKIKKASELANKAIEDAIVNNYSTEWIEQWIPKLLKALELDPLASFPIFTPSSKIGFGRSLEQKDLFKEIEKFVKLRNTLEDTEKKTKEIVNGYDVIAEFKTLMNESKRTENKGYEGLEDLGLSIPEKLDVDESQIYDMDLIQKTKATFRHWKTGWTERHEQAGDEFDPETYVEKLPRTFISDNKLSIRTKVAILLDHSSSIEEVEMEYKRATVALCEAMQYLGIRFAVFAFSTESKQVKCWIIKPYNAHWSPIHARRLAQIRALGGTPLAEIYALLEPVLKSFRPDIMATLTDGEPSDYDSVRQMVLVYRKMGIRMVALGVGRTLNDAVIISHNLKYLDYEKSLAVSRLQDIPKKVINLIRS